MSFFLGSVLLGLEVLTGKGWNDKGHPSVLSFPQFPGVYPRSRQRNWCVRPLKRTFRMCTLSCDRLCVTPWLQPSRLLCPWDSLGKNTGVGCHFLLQEIFPTRDGIHPSYISCTSRWVLYHCHLGSPWSIGSLEIWFSSRLSDCTSVT